MEKQEWEEEKKGYLSKIEILEKKYENSNEEHSIIPCLKQTVQLARDDLNTLMNSIITMKNEIFLILPHLQNAFSILRKSIHLIPCFISTYGKLCSDYQEEIKRSQIIALCDFSISLCKPDWIFHSFPFYDDIYFVTTLCQSLVPSSRSFFILSTYNDVGTNLWWNLCITISSLFHHGYVTLTAITGDNSFLSLYSGAIPSQQDFINIMNGAKTVGCHHCCTFEVKKEHGTHCFTIWNLSCMNELHKLDRSWSVLLDLLSLSLKKSSFLPFDNSELTKQMKDLFITQLESTIFLLDDSDEVVCMADRLQSHFHKERIEENNVEMDHSREMNALKNELFVMENDADAYEDEIRRLQRKIDEQNQIICKLRNQ